VDWLKNYFKDEDVFVLGDGPSLLTFDYTRLKGKKVIAVCEAFFRLREVGMYPNIWVFVDATFVGEIKLNKEFKVDPYADNPYRIIAGPSCTLRTRANCFTFIGAKAPSKVPQKLYYATHSGAAAINAAIISGARKIYLLGIDLGYEGDVSHSKPGHRMDGRSANMPHYVKQIKHYNKFAEISDRIVNLSHIVAQDGDGRRLCFPRLPVDEVLTC